MPQRPPNMSQLDYLWLNFGGREISSEVSPTPSDDVILSEKAVTELIKKLQKTGGGITSLMYDDDPLDPTQTRLTGLGIDGSIVTFTRMPKEVHVIGFVARKVTQEDIDNGFEYPLGSDALVIIMSNGEEHLVSLAELNLVLTGGETNSIYTDVKKGVISSELKIDKGNNELSVIKLKSGSQGVSASLELSDEDTGVNLTTEDGKLKASIPLGTTGYNLKHDTMTLAEYMNLPKKDPGTVYFITDFPFIYLGTLRYGVNIKPGDATIVSLVYDPDTMTLAYKRSDDTDIRMISLGPVSQTKNGMMSKEQYIELLKLKTALDDIVSVKDYVSEQISTVAVSLEWGEENALTKQLLLKNGLGDVLSTVLVEKENFLKFAESKKASQEDVEEAAKSEVTLVEGEQIIILTLTSGDKVYTSVNDLVDTYKSKDTRSIRMFINSDNEISADLQISGQDKMLYIYEDGLASHLEFVRSNRKVTIYGKTRAEENKIGEIDLADPKIKTIFVKEMTNELFAEYPPRLVNGKEFDRGSNPVIMGEPYLIECYGTSSIDPSQQFGYNDYTATMPILNGLKLSEKEGNLLSRDEDGYLYASLKLIDV